LASGIAFAGNPDLAEVPGNEPLGSKFELVDDCILMRMQERESRQRLNSEENRLIEPIQLREHVVSMIASVAVLPACIC
jgi:hypothetical protein